MITCANEDVTYKVGAPAEEGAELHVGVGGVGDGGGAGVLAVVVVVVGVKKVMGDGGTWL